MEFSCVFSIEGSLTSYVISKQNAATYRATLKSGSHKKGDIPETILLTKYNSTWQATPEHAEIVAAIIQAIEADK